MELNYLPWVRPSEWDDRPALRDARIELSYAEFGARVDAAAEHFAELGVRAGSVVAVMLPNRVELLVAMVGAWRLGAAATPINPVFTENEASYQINDADAALVVNAGPDAPTGGRSCLAVDDLRTEAVGTELPAPPANPDDLALLIYTSGSTGRPKGVMLNHANIDAMTGSMIDHVGINDNDHVLLILPLFHVNAIVVSFLCPTRVGAQLTVLERFHPVEFMKAVEEFQPTFFSAVPTIYSHLVTLPEEMTFDTSSMRFAICGAAPAAPSLLGAVSARFGFPMIEGYGLSEGTCASTANPVDGAQKPGTVGVALPGQQVEVMDPDGNVLPAGERGEVVIKGDNVMIGYLNRPEATAESLVDGWLHTGDVGTIDEDGYLTIVDRIKDMIIRGGENIYPKEIENTLQGHPDVLEAAVVGAPHQALGEVVYAYIAPRPDTKLDPDELTQLCRDNLTKVKVPVAIEILDELPKNPVGKIDKPTLRGRTPHASA